MHWGGSGDERLASENFHTERRCDPEEVLSITNMRCVAAAIAVAIDEAVAVVFAVA